MYLYLQRWDNNHQQLKQNGIDDVYAVNSDSAFICPYIERISQQIKPLFDQSQQFVSCVAQSQDIERSIKDLSQLWQYQVIVNNGEIECFWHNPIKTNMSWKVIKNHRYRCHGLGPEPVLKYLIDTQQ